MIVVSEIALAQLTQISTPEQNPLPKEHVLAQSSAGHYLRDTVQQKLAYS